MRDFVEEGVAEEVQREGQERIVVDAEEVEEDRSFDVAVEAGVVACWCGVVPHTHLWAQR